MPLFESLKTGIRNVFGGGDTGNKSARQGEGVIKKSSTPNSRPPQGPQRKLATNPYKAEDLRFPPNIGQDRARSHWIKFIPTIQKAGKYQVETTNQLSRADTNRSSSFGFGGQVGSNADPLNGAGAVAALGLLKTAETAVAGEVPDVLSDALKGLAGDKAAAGRALGAGVGAVASGALTAGVVSGINVTRKTRRAAAFISLYMPDTVTQTIVNDYDQVSLTQALGKAGLAAQAGGEIVAGDLQSIGGAVGPGGREVAGALAEQTGNFGAGITDVLLFSAGYAQNPQVELLFKSVQNREFLFDFKFTPRTQEEAQTIINIIKAFKFHAAPEIPDTGNGRYFVPPDEFDIVFMYGDKRNPNLPQLSTCVLQGIDVNYASAGQWTTFKDGMPVEISMQLRFKEVEIIHKALVADGY
jgi:hypothetical protein